MRLSNKNSLSSLSGVSNRVLDGGTIVDGYGGFRSYDMCLCVVIRDCRLCDGSVVCCLFFVLFLVSITDDTEDYEEGEEDGANKGSKDSDDFVLCRRVRDCFSDG